LGVDRFRGFLGVDLLVRTSGTVGDKLPSILLIRLTISDFGFVPDAIAISGLWGRLISRSVASEMTAECERARCDDIVNPRSKAQERLDG
jgi:hypothetical protein